MKKKKIIKYLYKRLKRAVRAMDESIGSYERGENKYFHVGSDPEHCGMYMVLQLWGLCEEGEKATEIFLESLSYFSEIEEIKIDKVRFDFT